MQGKQNEHNLGWMVVHGGGVDKIKEAPPTIQYVNNKQDVPCDAFMLFLGRRRVARLLEPVSSGKNLQFSFFLFFSFRQEVQNLIFSLRRCSSHQNIPFPHARLKKCPRLDPTKYFYFTWEELIKNTSVTLCALSGPPVENQALSLFFQSAMNYF